LHRPHAYACAHIAARGLPALARTRERAKRCMCKSPRPAPCPRPSRTQPRPRADRIASCCWVGSTRGKPRWPTFSRPSPQARVVSERSPIPSMMPQRCFLGGAAYLSAAASLPRSRRSRESIPLARPGPRGPCPHRPRMWRAPSSGARSTWWAAIPAPSPCARSSHGARARPRGSWGPCPTRCAMRPWRASVDS